MENARPLVRGSIKNTIYLELCDNATPFLPKAGFAFNVSGIQLSYCFKRGARVAITPASLASASAVWATGGVRLVDDVNQPGLVRFDLPDAMFNNYDGITDSVIFTVVASLFRTTSIRIPLIDKADVALTAGSTRVNS